MKIVLKQLSAMCLVVTLLFTVAFLLTVGCAKTVTAPVPGTINTLDAYAARSIGDAQAALIMGKTWEFCSDQKFPATVTFDNNTYPCDATAGPFPAAGRPYLFKAEEAYNVALAAAQSYHAGASSDTTALTQALTQLGIAVGNMLTGIGKGK
jgi:hypothetical protein